METPDRLAIKLKTVAEKNIRHGHPWVFSDSITKQSKPGKSGDLAIIFDHKTEKVIAIGLYDAKSPVRIKIIHHGGSAKIDEQFFLDKMTQAMEIRKPLLANHTNAYRLLFGENDGFPGLILDIYADKGVLKIYSEAWFSYIKLLIPSIVKLTGVSSIIIRMSRLLQNASKIYHEGDFIYGKNDDANVIFEEYGVRFQADLIHGHKTGFFLDHRQNRHHIGELSKGKTVLDVFSYAGGFSIHALANGASEVTSVDFSEQALELAKQNAALNPHSGKYETLPGDAFVILAELIRRKKKYDVVVIDPPSFAKSENETAVALKKYAELAELGVKLTKKGGILLLCSCSSRVSKEQFFHVHETTFNRLGIGYELLEKTTHDIDHPVTFLEGSYLKSAYYRIF